MIQLGVLDPRMIPAYFFFGSSIGFLAVQYTFRFIVARIWRATPCYEYLHGQRHAKPVHAKHRLIVACRALLQGMRSTWVLLQTI